MKTIKIIKITHSRGLDGWVAVYFDNGSMAECCYPEPCTHHDLIKEWLDEGNTIEPYE